MTEDEEDYEICECCGQRIERYKESPRVLKDPEPLEDMPPEMLKRHFT